MAKIAISCFLVLSNRAYAVAAENVKLRPAAGATTAVRKAVEDSASGGASSKKEENFWMRDPKTGNWIPENHFEEAAVAELREKFLPSDGTFETAFLVFGNSLINK